MSVVRYLMTGILKEELKEYDIHIEDFFKVCNDDFLYGQKRDNCGVIAASFSLYMKSKGVAIERIRGDFVTDVGVYKKLDFYKEEIVEMRNLGFNPDVLEDRMKFVEKFDLYERQKRIPHYWNTDQNGLIIDLSGYSQFVKTKLASDLNVVRYESEKLKVENNIKFKQL